MDNSKYKSVPLCSVVDIHELSL